MPLWTDMRKASSPFEDTSLPANLQNYTNSCGCGWSLGDRDITLLLMGITLECHRCHAPITIDEATHIVHGGYVRIFFDNARRWMVIKLKHLKYYTDYLEEHPEVIDYALSEGHAQQHNRTR
jgi:hypothetical protein